ncbi:MAG: hypothetical protein K0R84_2806 [Clostridia bacterium]|jgi:hypothetical protein|nr:hypothetical protein [Clostridia bacterium]
MTLIEIEKIMKEYGIAYTIIANLDSGLIETVGNIRDLTYDDLVNQLFADSKAIKSLNESLEGQTMPQSWKQGEVKCIVIKPTTNIIIGLLYNEHRSIIESMRFMKEINIEFIKKW